MPGDPSFLEVARRIAARLVDEARWRGEACGWEVGIPRRLESGGVELRRASAGPGLYTGTAGIALFLAELRLRAGADPAVERTLRGAIEDALAGAAALPTTSFGFFGGRVGIAYAAVRAGLALGDATLLERAEAVLAPARGREHEDVGIDVVAGAAGAIPVLLGMDADFGAGWPGRMALRLGRRLLETAWMEPAGWSWSTGARGSQRRHLCGLAHGVAGIAAAFLELYRAGAGEGYRYAAEQAFRYEDHFFDREAGNWSDLRIGERPAGSRAAAGGFVSGWCHGAPGIGLVRLRAWEVLGDDRRRAEALRAARAVADALRPGDPRLGNFSLCHGIAGNAELPLRAAEHGAPELRARVEAAARAGVAAHERPGGAWLCGTADGSRDPGLMLGEAGIGYFFLRLAAPDLPPLLLMEAPGARSAGAGVLALPLRRAYRDAHLRRAAAVFVALGVVGAAEAAAAEHPARLLALLEAAASAARGPARRLLADALRPERRRWRMSLGIADFRDDPAPASEPVPLDRETWLERAPSVRTITMRHDWDGWLRDGGHGVPPSAPRRLLLHRHRNRIHERPLTAFAELLLSFLVAPLRLGDLRERLALGVDVPPEALERLLTDQLRAAVAAGVIRIVPEPVDGAPP